MDWKEKAREVLENVSESLRLDGFEDGFSNSTVDCGDYLEDTYGFFDKKGNRVVVSVTIQEDDLAEEETTVVKENYNPDDCNYELEDTLE